MIQIRKIRTWIPEGETKEKKYDKVLDPEVNAPSVAELFANLDSYIAKIDPSERWNLYFTSHPCDTPKRKWQGPQEVIMFDIDSIDLERMNEYIDPVLRALGLPKVGPAVVYTGNGLQFIIQLTTPIEKDSYFDEYRTHYKACLDKIGIKLKEAGLPWLPDPSVWSTARLFRLPGTENRKAGKQSRQARFIEHRLSPVAFSLTEASGLPQVAETEQVPRKELKHFIVDTDGVKSGCEFLKHCKAAPEAVVEPQWFAMLSIVGRLKNGQQEAHEYSKGHPGYTHSETETKLEQALASSGPRTCKNINGLWGKCHTCPFFEKVHSPISIRGENFIPTEGSGFHLVVQSKQGTVYIPQYQDLLKYFAREYTYKLLGGSRICMLWDGKKYKEFEDAYLDNFAHENFKPLVKTHVVTEFRQLVQRTNLTAPEWFQETVAGRVNFANGVLNLLSGEFVPHTHEYGFRYVLGYDYDATALCPAFDQFLKDVTLGDESLEKLLLEYAGYALSGDECWAQKALVLEGSGANGKSTLMNVFRALAGKDNYASLTLSELKAEGNRQMLDGKLFNMAEETPNKALMDSSLFKNLVTGGETQVRQLYKKPYVMRNRAKLVFACNELPDSHDATTGYFRRFIIVPFRATFSVEAGTADPFIEGKLLQELPGIFNKVLAAYRSIRGAKKFSQSSKVVEALEAYKLEVDGVSRFLHEQVTVASPAPVAQADRPSASPAWTHQGEDGVFYATISELYETYSHWCISENEKPLALRKFTGRMRALIPDLKHRESARKPGGKTARVWLGLKASGLTGW